MMYWGGGDRILWAAGAILVHPQAVLEAFLERERARDSRRWVVLAMRRRTPEAGWRTLPLRRVSVVVRSYGSRSTDPARRTVGATDHPLWARPMDRRLRCSLLPRLDFAGVERGATHLGPYGRGLATHEHVPVDAAAGWQCVSVVCRAARARLAPRRLRGLDAAARRQTGIRGHRSQTFAFGVPSFVAPEPRAVCLVELD
jgi:hypothetical protein